MKKYYWMIAVGTIATLTFIATIVKKPFDIKKEKCYTFFCNDAVMHFSERHLIVVGSNF